MATSIVIDNLPTKIRVCVTDATGRFDVAEFPTTRTGGPAADQEFCDWVCKLDALMDKFAVPATSVYPDPADYQAPGSVDRLLPAASDRPSGPGNTADRIPD